MKYFVFDNFSVRILSVMFAVIAWFYVNIIVNPIVERQFDVELFLADKRNDCLYKNITPKVTIYLKGGRRDIIENYYPVKSKVQAIANVSKAVPDVVNKIPINAVAPRGLELVKIEPRELEFTPVLIDDHPVDININYVGEVKSGYYIKSADVSPKSVRIKGPSKITAGIKQINVFVNIVNLDAPISVKQPLNLVEVNANENNDVSITPKEVEISLNIQPLPSKQVPVVPVIKGKVAPGYMIAATECEPGALLIKGAANKIDKAEWIKTEPIDVSNISQSLRQNVKLETDEKAGYLVENRQVSVTIALKPIYKAQKFYNVAVNPPKVPDKYEVTLERNIDIEIMAPQLKIHELEKSKPVLDAKLSNAQYCDTGSVTFDLSIADSTASIEIKPTQIKGTLKLK